MRHPGRPSTASLAYRWALNTSPAQAGSESFPASPKWLAQRTSARGMSGRRRGQGTGEVAAACESIIGILGQRSSQNRVERGEFGSCVGQGCGLRVEVAADHDGGIGVSKRWCPGQEVIGGGGQGVLVGPAVDVLAHELFGCGVGDGAHRHVGGGQSAGVVKGSGNAEVGQEDSLVRSSSRWVSMMLAGLTSRCSRPLLVGIVQGDGDRGDDRGDHVQGHACGISLGHQAAGVGAVDEVHRDPQLAVVFAAVVHADDMGVPQSRPGQLHEETAPGRWGRRDIAGQQLQRIASAAAEDAGPGRPRPSPRRQAVARWWSRRTSDPPPTACRDRTRRPSANSQESEPSGSRSRVVTAELSSDERMVCQEFGQAGLTRRAANYEA